MRTRTYLQERTISQAAFRSEELSSTDELSGNSDWDYTTKWLLEKVEQGILTREFVDLLLANFYSREISSNQLREIISWASYCQNAFLTHVPLVFSTLYQGGGYQALRRLFFSLSPEFSEWPKFHRDWSPHLSMMVLNEAIDLTKAS